MAKLMKARLTLQDEILGSLPSDTEIYDNFIASKAPDALSREEEIEISGLQEVAQKGTTVFPRDEKGVFIWNYQIEGFFKGACKALKKTTGSKSSGLKAYKSEIDNLVFVTDRKNYIENIAGEGFCQRPLRGQTPKGETVSIAKSESISKNSTIDVTIMILKDDLAKLVEEWLDYGVFVGLGQWRNSGKGSFTWEMIHPWENISFDEAAELKKSIRVKENEVKA